MKSIFLTLLLLPVICISFLSACSSKTTTHTEKVVEHDNGGSYHDSDSSTRVETKTTTETVDSDEHEGGLFQIIGDIIALPFRAVGALLSAIF